MKLRLLSLALASFAFTLTSCKDTASGAPEETTTTTEQSSTADAQADAKLQTASFAVEGMSCAVGCANHIQKRLAKFEGVNQAEVDYENKTAKVTFDANRVSTDDLIKVIQESADGQTYTATLSPIATEGTSAVSNNEPKKERKKKKKGAKAEEATSTDAKPGCESGGEMKKSGCCSAKKA